MNHAHAFGTPCHTRCPQWGRTATPADWFAPTATTAQTSQPCDPAGCQHPQPCEGGQFCRCPQSTPCYPPRVAAARS